MKAILLLSTLMLFFRPHTMVEDWYEPISNTWEVEKEEEAAYTEEEIDILARMAQAEAIGEGEQGMRYVIAVALNRTEKEGFPDTVHDVVFEPYQFAVSNWASLEAYNAVYKEIEERSDYHILWFRTGHYHPYGNYFLQYGNHFFTGVNE